MKITDLRALTLHRHTAIIRIDTDEGIHGYGEADWGAKGPIPRDYLLALKPYLVGQDPTNVERVMLRIRHMGGPAHNGVGVGAVSMALWDIAGKAAGLPVYKLIGGKVRDRVRVYCDSGGGVQLDPADPASRYTPEAYAEKARRRKAMPEGYTAMKFDIGFHNRHFWDVPGSVWEINDSYPYQGHATERGLLSEIAIVEALKEVLGNTIGLALDCGPGQSLQASMVLAKALEPYNLLWAEDLLSGADTPWDDPDAWRRLSDSTTTPILCGENVYLRHGFRRIVDQHAVDVIAPDIQDCGGIADAKWLAEFADLYNVLIAPHNAQGVISFMANVHTAAAMPRNFIAFEFHAADSSDWQDLVVGIEKPLIREGFATVPDSPGLGIELNADVVQRHLDPGQEYFDS